MIKEVEPVRGVLEYVVSILVGFYQDLLPQEELYHELYRRRPPQEDYHTLRSK